MAIELTPEQAEKIIDNWKRNGGIYMFGDNGKLPEETNPIAKGFEAAINELCDEKKKHIHMPPEELIYKTGAKKIFNFMQEIFQFNKVDKLAENCSDDYMKNVYRENIKIAKLRKRFDKICEKFLYKYIYIKTGKTKQDLNS